MKITKHALRNGDSFYNFSLIRSSLWSNTCIEHWLGCLKRVWNLIIIYQTLHRSLFVQFWCLQIWSLKNTSFNMQNLKVKWSINAFLLFGKIKLISLMIRRCASHFICQNWRLARVFKAWILVLHVKSDLYPFNQAIKEKCQQTFSTTEHIDIISLSWGSK